MPRHVGDIAASMALQVGIRAFPDLRSPPAWSIIGVVESRTKMFWFLGLYISESRILFTPQSLRRSGEVSWRRSFDYCLLKFHKKKFRITRVSWNRSDGFVTRTLFLVPPVYYVALTQGVELRGVVVTILSLQFWNTWVSPTSKISFMQLLVR